jgi:short-subunit dehydrogenase
MRKDWAPGSRRPDSSRHVAGDQRPVALVAGASRGLGLLVARELGQRGYRVVICARNEDELMGAAAFLERAGAIPFVRVCDVTDREAVQELVDGIEAEVGPIETLITVAGIIQVGPLESTTMDMFTAAVDTMLWGPVNLALAVLPRMRERGAGQLGTVTSIGGIVSVPHLLPYSTAKFGAVGFSQGLAAELSGTGVTATTIVPGLMRTGSHLRAQFIGKAQREYTWFAASASMPLLSMNAERAARKMVDAVLAGKPTIILTPLAKIGARVHGVAPAATVRLMSVAARLLPKAPAGQAATGELEGRVAERQLNSRSLAVLTWLGKRAAHRFNEL